MLYHVSPHPTYLGPEEPYGPFSPGGCLHSAFHRGIGDRRHIMRLRYNPALEKAKSIPEREKLYRIEFIVYNKKFFPAISAVQENSAAAGRLPGYIRPQSLGLQAAPPVASPAKGAWSGSQKIFLVPRGDAAVLSSHRFPIDAPLTHEKAYCRSTPSRRLLRPLLPVFRAPVATRKSPAWPLYPLPDTCLSHKKRLLLRSSTYCRLKGL